MSKDYDVGRGKTPKHTRYKKGQSGNLKGRPKSSKNKGSVVREVIERKVTIRENGKTRKVTVFEALVESMVSKALHGSINEQIKLVQLIEKHAPEKLQDIPEEDREIVVRFVRPDGKGRPADRSLWTDEQRKRHAAEIERINNDPEVIAAWKAAGLDDDEDEPKEK